jgi:hypothetical protein
MAPYNTEHDVLTGTRTPYWSCNCGKENNWASRIKCQCGRSAPNRIINEARKADKLAKEQGGHRGDREYQGSFRGGGKQDKQDEEIRKLQRKIADMENREGHGSYADRDKPSYAAAARRGQKKAALEEGITSAEAKGKDAESKSKEQEKVLVASIKSIKELGEGKSKIIEALEEELADIRAKRVAAKPLQSQQQAALNKLGRAKHDYEKIKDRAIEVKEAIEELRKEELELKGKQIALATEVAAQEQVVRSFVPPLPPPQSTDQLVTAIFGIVPLEISSQAGYEDTCIAFHKIHQAITACRKEGEAAKEEPRAQVAGEGPRRHDMDSAEGSKQWPPPEEAEMCDDDYFDDEAMDEYLTALNESATGSNANPGGGASEAIVSEPAKADLRRKARELAEGVKKRRLHAKTKAEGQQP